MLSFNIIDIFILNKVLPSVVNKVSHKTLHECFFVNYRVTKFPYRPFLKKYRPNTDPFFGKKQTFYRPKDT